MTKHTVIFCAALLGMTLPAMAEIHECNRTRLSTTGFVTTAAAKSWYPEEIWFQIDGDKVPRSYYGEGSVKPDGERRLLSIDLATIDSKLAGRQMRVRLFTNGRAPVWMELGPRYVPGTPSRYACKRVQ